MTSENRWLKLTRENPDHSAWYIKRFRDMAAEGRDLHGEARMVDAMASRRSRILDAGCGPGRLGGHLHSLGHVVSGVDLDPKLIEAAAADHPGSEWIAADLSELDVAGLGWAEAFDIIVSAGNVMTFLAPDTRRAVLTRLRMCLAPEGRLVIGFGADRDYEFDDFRTDSVSAGLQTELELGTWDLKPFGDDSDFLVAVLSPSG